ncbi:aminotransferase class I/II-fold pyridoxal phosphate-dependent enzyme [Roseovarius sp. LXJ103]|uniref:pyridoxal phosphate-dependent aminotransferase n=1 Tax=Roseovarius carneus TaxID=2853164 RepID=UPI000D614A3E|nr:aminotransferase class I/II-fold pyridoxal phosphate-dependent enzyme [Roseovarius carneus]MBZ8118550.1 aminotransferase class I/II-fold pyridoxal phosphate-dependent enzyme [Roseovarius carneus]PWE35758.1 aspartate aminotransferase [Pelagicola sp. LXJ1103]
MQLSSRLTQINGGGSDGWDLFVRAREMIRDGTPVTELTIGEHDIRTDPSILDAMHRAGLAGNTGYTEFSGMRALRETVAARVEAATGTRTTPDNVLIVPGGQSSLYAAHYAALGEGDTGLFIDPYYATYPGTIRSVGAKAHPIAASADAQFQPDAASIDAAAKDTGAKSLLVNSPNNPTGVIYSDDTLQGIAEVCQDNDLWLISDEVYDTQVWTGAHKSPRALPGMAERTLVVGSMSKSHAMTGSRIGWLIGPEDVTASIGDLTMNTTYGVCGFIQEGALFALNQGAAFEETIAAPFRRRRDLVLKQIAAQNVVRAIPADGAMYVMLDIRATGMSGEAFGNLLLDTHHVAVMPGESFGAAAAGHIRLALTVDDAKLEEALAKLLSLAAEQAK